MSERPFDAVLLIAFGGPEKPADIRPFLARVAAGRPIPPDRLEEVAHHYELMGGRSPINERTRRQAELLQQSLALYRRLIEAGHSELDTSAVFKLYEQRSI